MKRTKLGIGLLLMLALVVTTGTFAYWATSVTGPTNTDQVGTVNIGAGGTVTTEYTITGGGTATGALVPAAYADNNTTFASRSIVWDVAWNDDGTTTDTNTTGGTVTGDIATTVSWVAYASDGTTVIANSAGTVTTYTGSLTVAAAAGNPTSMTLDAAATSFTFNVSMGEPASPAQYDLIENGSIVITVTYAISNIAIN